MISSSSVVAAIDGQVSSDLGGEAVILNLRNGQYYGLNTVGARIWTMIQQPVAVEQIVRELLDEYEVEADQCTSEVVALLQDMKENELVQIVLERAA